MTWKIEYLQSVQKDVKKLDHKARHQIRDFLETKLTHTKDPRSLGEALKGSKLGQFWKYRVGNYRIITQITDKNVTILVVKIGDRKDVYS